MMVTFRHCTSSAAPSATALGRAAFVSPSRPSRTAFCTLRAASDAASQRDSDDVVDDGQDSRAPDNSGKRAPAQPTWLDWEGDDVTTTTTMSSAADVSRP